MGRLDFSYLIFCVNKFLCFVLFFTIIIIKCKASFSCHSSSSHYSTQGFILISLHFIFPFLKNKIVYNFTCDLLFSFQISELKIWTGMQKKYHKNSQVNSSLRENISILLIAPLLSRRNVGMTCKERNQFVLIPEFLI